MDKRTLGRTGFEVTVLGYGAMAINDPNKVSDNDAEHILGSVLDAGITFVDTAPDYGPSEERIRLFRLSPLNRKSTVVHAGGNTRIRHTILVLRSIIGSIRLEMMFNRHHSGSFTVRRELFQRRRLKGPRFQNPSCGIRLLADILKSRCAK